ncbi:MAG TPA: CsiV family protein [Nevskiaceae bacterium]|nr:CsiV family protein [Nevskiaceae bacterium]
MTRALLLLLIAALPLAAHAERYRVDLVVFLDRGGMTTELPKPFVAPDLTKALELDPAALAGSSIELVPDAQFGMPEVWNRLRYSKRYQPLVKLAWIQADPTADRALPLHVHYGLPLAVLPSSADPAAPPPPTYQTVDGTVALRLSRYLFLDADLLYTQPQSDGALVSYALKEVRKMKRDELHYLDSPKLGIVAKVTKAPVAAAPAQQPSPVAH